MTSFALRSKPISARETSLTTIASSALALELLAGARDEVAAVLGREADQRLASARSRGERRRARPRSARGAAPGRPSLARRSSPRAARAGRKSATAAAISSTWAVGELSRDGRGQLGGGLDVDPPTAGRARQRDVGGDQGHLGAAARGALGEREAHAPARAVADEAHRVDRLAGAAGGDEDAQAVPGAARAPASDGLDLRRAGARARAAGPRRARRARRARPPRARSPHAALAQDRRGSPGSPRPRTCGRSSPGRRAAAPCRRGRRSSASSRRSRPRAWRSCSPRPGRRVGVGVGGDLEVADRVVRRRPVAREGAARRVALELVDRAPGRRRSPRRRRRRRSARRPASSTTRTPWPARVARRASSSAL